MSEPVYHSIKKLISMIPEPNRSGCLRILLDNTELFSKVPGSSHNHQAWVGGYLDHVQETMNIAWGLYAGMSQARALPFHVSDPILVMFLHDLEKPWKYELRDGVLEHKPELSTKDAQHEFRNKKFAEYELCLTPDQKNALKYVEGEFEDYSNKKRVMSPLAAFCHLCDVTSARIWHEYPLEHADEDPWGANRNG